MRRLIERGAEVQVVMTAGAREFVTPMTFQAVSGHEVRSDLWDEDAERAMSHIELARWADLILIAPATADFIARLAHGMADNLLTTLCLATERAGGGRAGDEPPDVGATPATQANIAHAARARRACVRSGQRQPGLRRDRRRPHDGAGRYRRGSVRRTAAAGPLKGTQGADHRRPDARTHRPGALHQQSQLGKDGLRGGAGRARARRRRGAGQRAGEPLRRRRACGASTSKAPRRCTTP